MKKVLYISYDGMTDVLGQAQVLPYLVGLSRFGYQITILSFEKKVRYEAERHIVDTIVKKAGIRWVPLSYTSTPPLLSKMFDRWTLRKTAIKLQKEEGFDLVHCRSYVASEAGLHLKSRFGVKYLFDMRGFWADERVDSGQWDLRFPWYRWIYSHYKRMEGAFLLQADGIVSLTEAGKNELLSKNAFAQLSIDVIPCCADLEHFNFSRLSEGAVVQTRQELRLEPGQKVLTYLGSTGGWYMTEEMFSFFRRLLDFDGEYVLLFITKDSPEQVKKASETAGVPPSRIRVIYSTRAELPRYLNICQASLFFIRPAYSKIASCPTKHGELMGMGIPVICNDIGDTGEIIQRTGTGFVIRDFSVEEYDRIIGHMGECLHIEKSRIRESAYHYFDLDGGVKRYKEIYHRVLSHA